MNTEERLNYLCKNTINLANARLGAEAVFSTDDFFAPMERMLSPSEPVFIEDKFDDNGKWMDGWESRRKRVPGHDYCIVRLGLPGIIEAINLDTHHFTGNFPPEASIEACNISGSVDENTKWTKLVEQSSLQGDSHNLFEISSNEIWNCLRVNIFPDGGIARLRVYGKVHHDWSTTSGEELIDLAAVSNGGRALECNDEHFGVMMNIIMPGKGINMGDGWETRRRREPGHDWVVLQLGHVGSIKKINVDTAFFKGNYPDRISIEGANIESNSEHNNLPSDIQWQTLITEQALSADNEHLFEAEVEDIGAITHIRINIHPDGGLSRVRLLGHIQV